MNNYIRRKTLTLDNFFEKTDIQPLHFCVDTISKNLDYDEDEKLRETELSKKKILEAQRIALQNQYRTNIEILNYLGFETLITSLEETYKKEIEKINLEIENEENRSITEVTNKTPNTSCKR